MEKDITFETAMKDLENIVNNLENGNLQLDEALNLFEKGIALTSFCNNKLEQAEKRITMLIEKKDGTFEEVDFKTEDI